MRDNGTVLNFLHSLLTIFSISLLFVAVGTLLWFVYRVLLRRLVRARRIANIRLKRIMDQAQEQSRHD